MGFIVMGFIGFFVKLLFIVGVVKPTGASNASLYISICLKYK